MQLKHWQPGARLKCIDAEGVDHLLTAGGVYIAETGPFFVFFPDRPYVTATGPDGRRVSCHARRFSLLTDKTEGSEL